MTDAALPIFMVTPIESFDLDPNTGCYVRSLPAMFAARSHREAALMFAEMRLSGRTPMGMFAVREHGERASVVRISDGISETPGDVSGVAVEFRIGKVHISPYVAVNMSEPGDTENA
jgi:hypothetical protein